MTLKKSGRFLALLFVAAMVMAFVPARSYAATTAKNSAKCYDISVNKTYKKYDITGDKKKDTIKVKTVSASSGSASVTGLTVYVNGKKCLKKDYGAAVKPTVKLIRLKNGKPYLYISALNQDGSYNSGNIYKYKSSKLNSALNLTKLVGSVSSYWDNEAWGGNGAEYVGRLSECIEKISGNSIYIRVKHSGGRFNAGDEVYRYDYKSGKLTMYKTFPLKYSKLTIDLENNKSYGNTGEQIWPFAGEYGTPNQGSVIPVKVSSSKEAVVTASRDANMGAGFSLRLKAYKKGTAVITITAADGRTAKLKLTVK